MAAGRYSDEVLAAFVDGELDDRTRAEIAAAMETDDAIAARIETFRTLRTEARDALETLADQAAEHRLSRAVSERLGARAATGANGPGRGARAIAVLGRALSLPAWMLPARPAWIMAAGLVIIAAVGGGYWIGRTTGEGGHVEAFARLSGPAIDAVLNTVSSGSEQVLDPGEARMKVIATFQTADRDLCREFEIDLADGAAFVAVSCRTDDGWRPRLALSTRQDTSGFAPAASLEVLDAYMVSIGAGTPLGKSEERDLLTR